MIIYVAGPYTPNHPAGSKKYIKEQDDFFKNVNNIGKDLILKGHIPIIPHNLFEGWELDPKLKSISYNEWIENTISIMMLCDALILTGGWKNSIGCLKERLHWKFNKDPDMIFYDVDEIN